MRTKSILTLSCLFLLNTIQLTEYFLHKKKTSTNTICVDLITHNAAKLAYSIKFHGEKGVECVRQFPNRLNMRSKVIIFIWKHQVLRNKWHSCCRIILYWLCFTGKKKIFWMILSPFWNDGVFIFSNQNKCYATWAVSVKELKYNEINRSSKNFHKHFCIESH